MQQLRGDAQDIRSSGKRGLDPRDTLPAAFSDVSEVRSLSKKAARIASAAGTAPGAARPAQAQRDPAEVCGEALGAEVRADRADGRGLSGLYC